MKKLFYYTFFTMMALIVFMIICLYTAHIIIVKKTEKHVYDSVESIPHNSVGLVLGTSKMLRKGVPNLYFKYRTEAVLTLFEAGKIDYVLVSGDNGSLSYNEPRDFKNELIRMGIPKENIFLDYAGFRTYDSMIRAKEVFGQSKFTVISQKFHNQRAVYIARRIGLDVVGYNAKDVEAYYGFKTQQREKFARVKVFIDFLLNKKPRFLGEPVVIE